MEKHEEYWFDEGYTHGSVAFKNRVLAYLRDQHGIALDNLRFEQEHPEGDSEVEIMHKREAKVYEWAVEEIVQWTDKTGWFPPKD